MATKRYVRPAARAKKSKDRLSPQARQRQIAGMKAYWAKWRKEHGKNPVTTEEAPEVEPGATPEEQTEQNRLQVRSAILEMGERLGIAIGRGIGGSLSKSFERLK